MKKFQFVADVVWNAVKSPKTAALLRLGAAVVGVIHAIKDLKDLSNVKTQD